jgi:nitroimidazol reductase NimA-like FMN-containing flavoprotein (pyridoxamine 5'-phosphate oxidase superfamily)
MSTAKRPAFSDLTRDESIELLGRGHTGRIAFTFHDRVDIEPISYVYADGWLYARTSQGTKLQVVQHTPWVAFEVDEVEGRFDWRSVVVRGTIYFLDGAEGERDAYHHAVEVLRTTDTEAFREDDPVPHRTTVFRIHVNEITGRMASTH